MRIPWYNEPSICDIVVLQIQRVVLQFHSTAVRCAIFPNYDCVELEVLELLRVETL